MLFTHLPIKLKCLLGDLIFFASFKNKIFLYPLEIVAGAEKYKLRDFYFYFFRFEHHISIYEKSTKVKILKPTTYSCMKIKYLSDV
ncbi:MAG: hypothetical protein ACD_9C00262G0007 [uncultured bacterium]|nr:MAG: hypothetical protein ACD_9C00262G0007 [uncultured bacterium]